MKNNEIESLKQGRVVKLEPTELIELLSMQNDLGINTLEIQQDINKDFFYVKICDKY